MEEKYCYKYPRPAVTTDCVVFNSTPDDAKLLLVKRANEPFKGKWALPGGFLEENETLEECAARELEEETGLKDVELSQFEAFSAVDRDPRGRTISVVYVGKVELEEDGLRAGDDAKEAAWFPVDKLPELAFDHREIVFKAMRWQLCMSTLEYIRCLQEEEMHEESECGKANDAKKETKDE